MWMPEAPLIAVWQLGSSSFLSSSVNGPPQRSTLFARIVNSLPLTWSFTCAPTTRPEAGVATPSVSPAGVSRSSAVAAQ